MTKLAQVAVAVIIGATTEVVTAVALGLVDGNWKSPSQTPMLHCYIISAEDFEHSGFKLSLR